MYALKVANRSKLNEWTDLWFTEQKKAGYVAITDFKRQLFYGANDVTRVIEETKGVKTRYISINAFKGWNDGVQPNRQSKNLKQIRNIAIDIDQYNLGLSIDEAIDELQALILDDIIPEPNLVLVSRGIQIFYSIENGASPSMAWLSDYITSQLIAKLEHIGADFNAKDVSRVMRVPNSVNERNGAIVEPTIWNDTPYTLDELQSYCKPLNQARTRKIKRSKVISINEYEKVSIIHKVNYSRIRDFKRLIELRKGNFTNTRNEFLYMYAYHEALLFNTQKDVITSVKTVFKDVYSTKDKPMSNREFERTVKSAYKDAHEFFEHFKDNGYKIIYKLNDGIKKPFKTSTIIEKLDIKEMEQYELSTLHDTSIKRDKDIKRLERKRRSEGMQTMENYNKQRQQDKQDKVNLLKQLMIDNPQATRKELATLLGVSKARITQLKKEHLFGGK